MHRSRIGIWGRHLDSYHCRPLPLGPKRGAQICFWGKGTRGALLVDIGIPAKRRQIEQDILLRGTWKLWVGLPLVQIPTPNASLILETSELSLKIDSRCEVIVVAIFSRLALKLSSTSAVLVFSCPSLMWFVVDTSYKRTQ